MTTAKGTSKQIGSKVDDESKAILYEGANLSQLCILFRMDHRVLVEKLHGVKESSMRGGYKVYRIDEVAPYLVKPMYDIENYIRKMHHNDLPKMLTKEFWAGQRSKQEYLLREGDLWPTDSVIEKVSELFKLIKMQARLGVDAVERQTELTPRQRSIMRGIFDGMLRDLNDSIVKHFSRKEKRVEIRDADDDTL